MLAFAAEHRFVLAEQVGILLGCSANAAYKRLHRLRRNGYLRYDRKMAGPGGYQIQRQGLSAIGSALSRPRDVDPRVHQHDERLGWLWIAAQRGVFGRLDAVVSEREMRSHDGRVTRSGDLLEERLGVRLAGERTHYPDLLLRCSTGHHVAVELELSKKSRYQLDSILSGYAFDRRIDRVLYLVEDDKVGRAIERSAAQAGVSSLIMIQRVSFETPEDPPEADGLAGVRVPNRDLGPDRGRHSGAVAVPDGEHDEGRSSGRDPKRAAGRDAGRGPGADPRHNGGQRSERKAGRRRDDGASPEAGR